jgi:hypothetical protein
MKTFFSALWLPGGVGILGIMLAVEKTESWYFRLLGGALALILSPFILLTMVGLFVHEAVDKIKSLKT